MLLHFVVGLRTCCIAAVLLVATMRAGEPPHPLLGATRDQVLNRLGEPRSQLSSSGREVMFYPRERLVLNNGVVVEVERLVADPPRKAPGSDSPTRTPGPTAGVQPKASDSTEPSSRTVEPGAARGPDAPAGSTADSRVEIKLVRPPSAITPASTAEEPPEPVVPAPAPAVPVSDSPPPSLAPAPEASSPSAARSSPPALPGPVDRVAPGPTPVTAPTVPETAPEPPPSSTQSTNTPSAPDAGSGIGFPVLAIAGALLLGAVGYLVWRSRQRQLELEATAVEATPVGAASPVRAPEVGFSLEFLAGLDAAHFEELVAAYYAKTGVVATRMSGDPANAVQIKISWKGEARPFALVQCISQPSGPIDAQPLQRLHEVLGTEKIRRGYVVSSGKFSPAAREFAEQNGLTLLPGDVFLEKITALPDSARVELMQAIRT